MCTPSSLMGLNRLLSKVWKMRNWRQPCFLLFLGTIALMFRRYYKDIKIIQGENIEGRIKKCLTNSSCIHEFGPQCETVRNVEYFYYPHIYPSDDRLIIHKQLLKRYAVVSYGTITHIMKFQHAISAHNCLTAKWGIFYHLEVFPLQSDRLCHWTKIRVIQKYLAYYDAIIYTDVDMVFNPESNTKILELLEMLEGHDLLLQAGTHPQAAIDAGAFIIKNTKWSKTFLKSWLALSDSREWLNMDNGALHIAVLSFSQLTKSASDCSKLYDPNNPDLYLKNRDCFESALNLSTGNIHVSGYTGDKIRILPSPSLGLGLVRYDSGNETSFRNDDILIHTKQPSNYIQTSDIYCT